MKKLILDIVIFLMIALFSFNSANANDKCDVSFLIEHHSTLFDLSINKKMKEEMQNLTFDCAKQLSNKSVELDKILYEAGFPSLIYVVDKKEIWSSFTMLLKTGDQYYFRKDPEILSRLQHEIEEGTQLQQIYDFISASRAPLAIAAHDNQKQFYSHLDYLLFFPVYNEVLANKFLKLCEIYNCLDVNQEYGSLYKTKIDFIKGNNSINDIIDDKDIDRQNKNALWSFLDEIYLLRKIGILQSNCSLHDKINSNADIISSYDFICEDD